MKIYTEAEKKAFARDFGGQVANWRKAAGLTQTALANDLGVSQGFIQAIEDGRKRIAMERMEAYARAIHRPVDELYEEHIRGHDPEAYWFLRRLWGPSLLA